MRLKREISKLKSGLKKKTRHFPGKRLLKKKVKITLNLPQTSILWQLSLVGKKIRNFRLEFVARRTLTREIVKGKYFSNLVFYLIFLLTAHLALLLYVIFRLEGISWGSPEMIGIRRATLDFLTSYFTPRNKLYLGELLFVVIVGYLFYQFQHKFSARTRINKIRRKVLNNLMLLTGIFYLLTFFTAIGISILYAGHQTSRLVKALSSPENLNQIGAVYKSKEIKESLEQQEEFPSIIAVDDKIIARIVTVLYSSSRQTTFYNTYILPVAARKLKMGPEDIAADVLYLPSNVLVVSRIDKETFKSISPILAKIMLSSYFPDKFLEFNSDFNLVSRQEYIQLREKEFKEVIEQLDDYIAESRRILAGINSNISKTKNTIQSYEQKIKESEQERDSTYNYCKTAVYKGFYYTYRLYSDSYCDSVRAEWENYIADLRGDIQTLNQNLGIYHSQWAEEKEILDLLLWYKESAEERKNLIPNELGIFKPDKNKIFVVLDDPSTQAIADYLATLAHEYLHSSTYISEEKLIDNFFEEGLTEYLSRNIVKNATGIETALGYPVLTKVMAEIVSDIPSLQDVYFSKDQARLEELITREYGKDFYEKNALNFFLLSYISGEEALKVANALMLKIGGEQLDEEDVTSRISEYVN